MTVVGGRVAGGRPTGIPGSIETLRRRLLAISVGVFIGVQGLIVLLAFAGIGVSEVARSYATGEALYSKAQKEAVIDLLRYSRTHSEADFAAYEGSIAVLNGDHTARVALERANPDLATARAGFLTGHNSTADVSRLIQGYLLFQDWPPFAKAVDDWRAADVRADALQALAFELHRSAAGPGSDADFARIETLDAQLSGLERQFSAQMGATARLATSLAYAAIALISLAACIAGLAVGWRVQRALTRAGEELALARDRAEEASRAKSEFLANMSHEIRTPLTGVIGFGELLMKEPLEPPAADYAARIVTSGQALLGVVNDILDFSKIEAGQVELDPQPLDPARFLAETADLVGPEAERKGLALVVEPGWLPAALAVDAGRVRQVLLNLLTNAVKFTRQGEVRIAARYDEDAALLRIEVSDTGIGIPEDRRNRLFQRFSQADGSTSREFGGSGLGLAICRRLTELMGGDIGVTSRAGVGSTFWVTVAAPVAALAPDADAKAEAAFEALPARILVVDDLAANREITRALLGPFGHDIVEAAGGQEAVDLAACSPYDLILMDMQMPGMDGLAATRLIRRDQGPNRWTPIVALSANVMADHLAACRDAGMDDHVGKPILVADLIAKVAQWAGRTHEAIDPTTLSAAAS